MSNTLTTQYFLMKNMSNFYEHKEKWQKTKNHLTPNACALIGNVVLQIRTKSCLAPPLTNCSIVHQKESLIAVVQAIGVMWWVLDIVTSRKTPLQTDTKRLAKLLSSCWRFNEPDSPHPPVEWCTGYLNIDQLLPVVDQTPGGHTNSYDLFLGQSCSCSAMVSHSFTHTTGHTLFETPCQNPGPWTENLLQYDMTQHVQDMLNKIFKVKGRDFLLSVLTCALCSPNQPFSQDISHPWLNLFLTFSPYHWHHQVGRGQTPVCCHQGVDDMRLCVTWKPQKLNRTEVIADALYSGIIYDKIQ